MDHTTYGSTDQPHKITLHDVNFEVQENFRVVRKESVESSLSSVKEDTAMVEGGCKINIFLGPDEKLGDVQDWGGLTSGWVNDDGLSNLISSSSLSTSNIFSKKVFDICLEICSLAFTICDMAFVGILVYRHYMADDDPLQAWAMLLPIFLSTFGVQLFFERYPPTRHWYNEILNIPLLGPIFCTGELLYAKLKPASEETHRIEAESIKLKQFESMFRAFPESMVMLSVLFINRTEHTTDFLQTWMMEILCVIFGVVCLAESHWYGIVSDFYRIHDKGCPTLLNHEDRQRPHKLHLWQKCLLFIHAVFAIGLRVFCEGLIRATVYFHLNKLSYVSGKTTFNHSFAEILLIVFFVEIGIRALLHLLAQIIRELSIDLYKWLLNPFYEPQYRRRPCGGHRRGAYARIDTRALDGMVGDDESEYFEGIHGAVKHGLLATFSPLQFQSKYLPTMIWFYLENLTFLVLWFVFTRKVELATGAAFIVYDRQVMFIAMVLFFASLLMQGVVSYLTMPESDICVIQIRRVPRRYVTMPSFPTTTNL